jgi:hypothetical protein
VLSKLRPNGGGTNGNGSNGGASGANGSANESAGSSNAMQGAAANLATCGNGSVDMGETCDPASSCPSTDTCTSTNACLKPMLVGMPSLCNVKCELVPVEDCKPGDGCCPKGCDKGTDDDCSDSCGDGVIGKDELCEPRRTTTPCRSSCDDMDPCTKDMQTGTPAQCNVDCTHAPITQPASGDQCCPPGANANNDSDCSAKCGNGVKEGNEKCDGSDCPTSCDNCDGTLDEDGPPPCP